MADAGVDVLWVETEKRTQVGTAYAAGDRESVTTYTLYTTGGTYRLRPLRTQSFQRVGSSDVMFAEDTTTWDSTYRVATMQSELLDAAGNLARTSHTDRKSTRLNSSHSQISYAV